ncbi:hypothetical protein EYF80_018821 [Liparis tanakae]|uniref:Uncharacterized protein n=1 Tax=Liparis tanakae TaxID=230148 RepID=A0A4Z2I089_9TELE|nr:hypothetical protein EYF80_018821 [Liparis tanakae]
MPRSEKEAVRYVKDSCSIYPVILRSGPHRARCRKWSFYDGHSQPGNNGEEFYICRINSSVMKQALSSSSASAAHSPLAPLSVSPTDHRRRCQITKETWQAANKSRVWRESDVGVAKLASTSPGASRGAPGVIGPAQACQQDLPHTQSHREHGREKRGGGLIGRSERSRRRRRRDGEGDREVAGSDGMRGGKGRGGGGKHFECSVEMGDVHWSLGFIVPESLEVEVAMAAHGSPTSGGRSGGVVKRGHNERLKGRLEKGREGRMSGMRIREGNSKRPGIDACPDDVRAETEHIKGRVQGIFPTR